MADRISPLQGLLIKGRYGKHADMDIASELVISHRMCTSLVQVNAWPDTDGKVRATLQRSTELKLVGGSKSPANKDYTILPVGPGRYLIEAEIDDLELQLRKRIVSDQGAVIGLSHARIVITLSGAKATWVLSKGIAVDFSPGDFPLCSCVATSHHDIGLTIRRTDDDRFDIFVFTSLARSFWQWLEKAAGEVGYEIE